MLLSRLPLRIATALDLHVLGLPPAFALSQDQTLKFEILIGSITTFDESQARRSRSARADRNRSSLMNRNVGPPKSRLTCRASFRPRRQVRKDSAAHVSLSSDPQFQTAIAGGGTASVAFRKSGKLRSLSPPASRRPRNHGTVMSFAGAPSRRDGGAPW